MAKTKGISRFTIAATYVGTVVGAGFATGQEVLRFFTHFGANSLFAVVFATALFAVLGGVILRIGHHVRADSHVPIVEAVTGPLAGRLLDLVITFFLFGGSAVMFAGSGAVFAEHWHLNRFLGTLVMAGVAGGTVMLGLRGVVASISAVAPVLIALVTVISIGALVSNGLPPANLAWNRPDLAATGLWPISLFLYVSYNLVLSVSVLGPLGKEAKDADTAGWGGVIGGLALGIGIFFINLALISGLPGTAQYEVPMLHLARGFPAWIAAVYSVVLWAEVYTTAVAGLYGLSARFSPPGSHRFRIVVPLATVGALLLSQMGFARMVGVLFPAVGWLGLLLVGGLLWHAVRPRLTL